MGERLRRYAVSLARNPYSSEQARQLFSDVDQLARNDDGSIEGEVPTLGGRRMKVRAFQPLGSEADVFVAKFSEADRLDLQKSYPLLSFEEDIVGRMARFMPELRSDGMAAAGGARSAVEVRVVDEQGAPLSGVLVRMIFDPDGPIGVEERTDATGVARLLVSPARAKALYVTAVPDHSRWPATQLDVALEDGLQLGLACGAIDLAVPDGIDRMFRTTQRGGQGVVVAIVDGGVGPHAEVPISHAETVLGDNQTLDNGIGHGTHVAGIIHRLAPQAELRSYRVFADQSENVNASSVAEAIRRAVTGGAHIINVSITFKQDNELLRKALLLANARGVLCVCAAGNSAGAVLYPARLPEALAVAACGVKTWSDGALDYQLIDPPGHDHTSVHAAAFTCHGPEVMVTAPGVGVVSAYPNDRYAVMSGTSMSSPAITGLLASALARSPAVLALPPDPARSNAIARIAVTAAILIGLPVGFEGHGVPFLGLAT